MYLFISCVFTKTKKQKFVYRTVNAKHYKEVDLELYKEGKKKKNLFVHALENSIVVQFVPQCFKCLVLLVSQNLGKVFSKTTPISLKGLTIILSMAGT